jgi:hypothetical protein
VTFSASLSVTVKVASPLTSVTPVTVVTDELPLAGFSATVLPDTTLPSASASTTVIVEFVEPSAGTWDGSATIVESAMAGRIGGGVPNVTVTPCPANGRLSLVSDAV